MSLSNRACTSTGILLIGAIILQLLSVSSNDTDYFIIKIDTNMAISMLPDCISVMEYGDFGRTKAKVLILQRTPSGRMLLCIREDTRAIATADYGSAPQHLISAVAGDGWNETSGNILSMTVEEAISGVRTPKRKVCGL